MGTGLTWAAGWAVAGIGIGASTLLPWHPFERFMQVMDAPLPAMALPGFFAGLFFSSVLGIAGRRFRFHELTTRQFVALGAVGGALLVLFPFLLVALGMASADGSPHSAWSAIAAIAPVFVGLSAASAAATLVLARRATDRHSTANVEDRSELLGEALPDLGRSQDARDLDPDRVARPAAP